MNAQNRSGTTSSRAGGGPAISVIIPNYNHTQYLREAIGSVLAQTAPVREIIVVDDGSTDDCRAVVAGFGARVQYVFQENQGLAGARNTGLRHSCGELVGFLDADDQWRPTFVESLLAQAAEHPDATVYFCAAQAVDETGSPLPQIFGGPICPTHQIHHALLRANFLIPSTIAVRREPILQAGLFDVTLRSCEDWDLWLRLLPRHQFVGRDEALVLYRQHGASLSGNVAGMQRAARAVIEKNFGADTGDSGEWSPTKRRAFGGLYRYLLLNSIQRGGDWASGVEHLGKALKVDDTLATDLELFYDLALGSQAPGYRGTAAGLDLTQNARRIETLLQAVLEWPDANLSNETTMAARATAHQALGLAAYNTGHYLDAIRFLLHALRLRPALWRDRIVVGDLLKASLLSLFAW